MRTLWRCVRGVTWWIIGTIDSGIYCLWTMLVEFNKRKLVYPLKWILTRIGKTGYWFNQTFIPMGNYLHYWMKGDEALARYKQPYDPRWFRKE